MHVINALRHFVAQRQANEAARRRRIAQISDPAATPSLWILHAR
ncbi:MAG: hypothetical protein ACXWNK_03755 [Vulcanimicrobiaceae bacterium]